MPPRPRPPGGTSSPAPPGRVVSLDVLRAVAVLLVMGRHLGAPHAEVPFLQAPLAALVRGGWVGVDLFFVLSGFLVGGLLLREHARHGALRPGRFWIRRGLKIWPAFYVFLAVTVAVRLAVGEPLPGRRLVAELVYLQNYRGGLWDHTWSLAVEEHFYLILPLLLLGLQRRRKPGGGAPPFPRLPALAGLIMAGALVLRLAHAADNPYNALSHLEPTHLRLDGMMFGVLLAWIHHVRPLAFHRTVRRGWPLLLAVGALALAPPFLVPVNVHFVHTWGLTLNYLGAGAVTLGALGWEGAAPRRRGVLARVGFHSYSIYLWHMPVRAWLLPWLTGLPGVAPGSLAALALFAGASCAVGVVAARAVEVPVLRLRDRFFPSRSGALIPAFAGEGMGPHTGPEAAEAAVRSARG